jgi:hypothetical protein
VLAGLGDEDDKPMPLMSTPKESPNLTEPRTSVSRSEKNSRRLVMWCVAPLSRNQPSILSSLEPSPRKTLARGSSRWSRAVVADVAGAHSMLT